MFRPAASPITFWKKACHGPCPVLYLVPWFKKRDKHEKMDKNDPAREIAAE
jgi:hypothetical protein